QQAEVTTIEEEGRSRTDEGPPIEALRKILAQHQLAKAPDLPRFAGGLLGYLPYGAVRWFAPRVPQRHGPHPAFPDAEWMLTDRLIAFDNLTHRIRLIACADLARHPSAKAAFVAAAEEIDKLSLALSRSLPPAPAPIHLKGIEDSWGRESFLSAV